MLGFTVMSRTRIAIPGFVACMVTLGLAGTVRADATLTTATGDADVHETDHRIAVQIDGTVATVRHDQTLVNRGKRARVGVYTFSLPRDAAVTGMTVQLADGRTAVARVVDADAAIRPAPDAKTTGAEPDIGLLRLVELRDADPMSAGAATATYELRVYPVEAGRAVAVRTEWTAPLRYDDGRLSLRIPGRGAPTFLARETVTLDVQAPAGAAAIGAVYGGGRMLAKRERSKRARYRFTAPADGDLVVETAPEFGSGGRHPLVSFATSAIDKQRGVVAVSVLAPPPTPGNMPTYERAIVVVDVSRSMGKAGVEAARAMVEAVLDAAGADAVVEVILYDRTARAVLGGLTPNTRDSRERIARSLAAPPLANGSDLGLALDEVRDVMAHVDTTAMPDREGVTRGVGPTTLIAIVSDGMTPLSLTDARASDRIGQKALAEAEVLSITIVPDGAPAPDTTAGPLGSLARVTGGRSIAVKTSGAAARAAALSVELTRPPAIELPRIELRGVDGDGLDLPAKLEPGRGAFIVGTYAGRAPTAATLRATIKGADVAVKARRVKGSAAAAAVPLWLGQVELADFVPREQQIAPDQETMDYDAKTLSSAREAMLGAARKRTAVTRYSSLVAVDRKDKFAAERLAFAERWGASHYFRVQPPAERNERHVYREVRVETGAFGGADATWRPTGDLSRDIVARLMRTYVLPKAQVCYQHALAKHRKLAGSLVVEVEIARGEVQHARITRSNLPGETMDDCVLEAAYSIQVPRVALGDDTEYIGVARYPIKFQLVGKTGRAGRGSFDRTSPADASDPLGGIPDEK